MLIQARQRLLSDRSSSVPSALSVLSNWFNVTNGTSVTSVKNALRTLTSRYGYTPYGGKVYRSFTPKPPIPNSTKVGTVLKLRTGKKPIQSWSSTEKGASQFLGNDTQHLLVELLSPGLELCNNEWLWKLALTLQKDTDASIRKAAFELSRTIRRPGSSDDEAEVIMELPEVSKVRLINLIRAFH